MTSGSARVRAVEVLRETLERGGRATFLLAEKSRGLSPSDGDLMRRIVLGVLRTRSALDAELAAACKPSLDRLVPGLREILEVALYQIRHLDRVPAYAAVDEAVAHAKATGGEKAGGLVNAVLRNLLRRPPRADRIQNPKSKIQNSPADLAQRFSHPEFLVSRWLDRFGKERAIRVLEADNAGSPLDLVVNPRKTDRETLARALEAEGVATEPSSLSPLGLTVLAGNPLASPLLAAGQFSVQDIGSQLLPLLLPPGDLLLDLAAAPGGKSFAALALGRARRVVCLDVSAGRLLRLVANRERLGMRQAFPIAADIQAPPFSAARFHRILFDAPCSGTGTLRKNPEIRYRITPQAIERLSRAQERGLGAAARLLAPGGYLLYATCSLELEENERVVERVFAARPELEPAPIAADDALKPLVDGNRFRILPGPTSDGFTAHLLRRRLEAARIIRGHPAEARGPDSAKRVD